MRKQTRRKQINLRVAVTPPILSIVRLLTVALTDTDMRAFSREMPNVSVTEMLENQWYKIALYIKQLPEKQHYFVTATQWLLYNHKNICICTYTDMK